MPVIFAMRQQRSTAPIHLHVLLISALIIVLFEKLRLELHVPDRLHVLKVELVRTFYSILFY